MLKKKVAGKGKRANLLSYKKHLHNLIAQIPSLDLLDPNIYSMKKDIQIIVYN